MSTTIKNSLKTLLKLKKLYVLAFPMIATNALKALNSVLSIFWIGRFLSSSDHISGVTLGTLIFNVSGLSTLYGLASGLGTLLSQAEGAGPNTSALRALHVKRVSFILVIAGLILGLFPTFAEPILGGLGQPVSSAKIAGVYARVIYWGSMLPTMITYVQQSILNTRRHTRVPLIATLVATLAHVLIALFFLRDFKKDPTPVTKLPLGNDSYLAPAIARIAFSIISSLIIGIYLIWIQDPVCPTGCCCCVLPNSLYNSESAELTTHFPETKKNAALLDHMREPLGVEIRPLAPMFQWAGFRNLLALCLPSMFMMIAEWWSFEFLAIMAGWITPNPPLNIAADGVMYSMAVFVYQIYRGMGSAAGILVGNALGSSNTIKESVITSTSGTSKSGIKLAAQAAKQMCWLGIASTGVIALIISIIAYWFRDHLGQIMTRQQDVNDKVTDASISLILAMYGYALLMPSIQVLQGCGLQQKGAIFTAIGYYLIGLPLAWFLAFPCTLGLRGIWFGNAAALWSAALLSMLYIAFYVDWEKEVQKANDRMRQEHANYEAEDSEQVGLGVSNYTSFSDGIIHKNSSMYGVSF